MVFAVMYVFGLKSGVGADTLSLFFKMIRVDRHVGVSPSAIRTQLNEMEVLLPQFQNACEQQVKNKPRKIVAGLDETFFGDFMILVLMDLRSGYLLLEDIADDRCFDTWFKKTAPRLEQLGIEINHAISDRARALIKMAVVGFDCDSGADTFHAQQDVSRWLGARIGKRVSKMLKQWEAACKAEKKSAEKAMGFKKFSLKLNSITTKKELNIAQQRQADYHENLQGIAEEIHPFSLNDNRINEAEDIKKNLESRAQQFEKIAQSQSIQDSKKVM